MTPASQPVATGDYPGIHIDYHEKPFRHYLVNELQVPSVTTVLGILNKPALPFWAAKVTAEGAWKLVRQDGYHVPNSPWDFISDLKANKLDHQSATGAAADRGVEVHQVWEDWNTQRIIPNASLYPENRRGYIQAMAKFIMKHEPVASESESVVGSVEHGFAGRLDTVVVLNTKQGPALLDVKTSKAVYPGSHFPQLIGYEIARRECGLEPSEHQGILRLGADSTFEVRWSDAEPEDFLCLLRAYNSQQRWVKKGQR